MTTAADWSGRVGEVWAEEWCRTERSFSGLEPPLGAAILAVAPDRDRFLDIGCGVGTTSLAVARARPDAQVLGVDLSPGMIDVARSRATDTPNVSFVASDVLRVAAGASSSRHPGSDPSSRFASPEEEQGEAARRDGQPYDLLFSRHGVMFFPDPAAAFRTLHAAAARLAPLVFSCFAAPDANPWATLVTDTPARSTSYVPGPFAFADEDAGRALLIAAGWRDPQARRVEYRYLAGEGEDPVADAVALFTRIGPAASALRDTTPAERPTLLARLAERIAPYARGDRVDFPAAAWIWSARA